MPAFMPQSRIKRGKPTVSGMGIGESGYVPGAYIWVKPDLTAFVSRSAELQPREEDITVQITRLEDGYHLKLDGCTRKWEAMDDGWLRLTERYGEDSFEP